MPDTLEQSPILGLDEGFPEQLVIIHLGPDAYCCYCLKGIHGLTCFTTLESATSFFQTFFAGSPTYVTGIDKPVVHWLC